VKPPTPLDARRAPAARPAGAGRRRGRQPPPPPHLIAWAKEGGLFVRVDRATPWGNQFVIGRDGYRAAVIAAYRDRYLPSRPDLLARHGSFCSTGRSFWPVAAS